MTWSSAVFDGFLLEELEELSRQALVEDAFVQASVEAEIVERPQANEKEIRLQIEPGPRFSERHVTFLGNQYASDLQLADYLDARGLAASAWTNPESIVETLTTLYRSLGFLDAEIQLGVPVFEHERAKQPFLIQEHPAYRISEVGVSGVAAFDEGDILRATGLVPDDDYTDSAVQRARANVGARYRRDGFTLARVSVQSTVDRDDGVVAIDVNIEEGPRQIVQEVVIAGVGRTRPELISRALQIEVGQPVDVAGWNLARKRLYDTGAFRSVDIEAHPLESSPTAVEATQAVRARVVLEEWPTFRFRYGLQLKDERAPLGETGREFNLGVVGDLTHPNFLGRAATVGTAFRYDTIQQALRGFLTFRTFFGLPLTSNVFSSRLRENFSQDEFGFIDEPKLLHLAATLLAGALWLALRRRQFLVATLQRLDAGATILLSTCYGLMALAAVDVERLAPLMSLDPWRAATDPLMACTFVVLLRALVIPSPAIRTIWISALSMLPIMAVGPYVLGRLRIREPGALRSLYTRSEAGNISSRTCRTTTTSSSPTGAWKLCSRARSP